MNYKITEFFLVKNPPQVARQKLGYIVGSKSKVFNDFSNSTDVLYGVAQEQCQSIAKFLLKNKLRFKFFPKRRLERGLNPQTPEQAQAALFTAKSVISSPDELRQYLGLPSRVGKDIEFNTRGTLNAFNLNGDVIIFTNPGTTKIVSKLKGIKLLSSPVNRFGTNYVMDYSNPDNTRYYMVQGDKILFEYPKEMSEIFEENFRNVVGSVL